MVEPTLQLTSPPDDNNPFPKVVLATLVMIAVAAAVYFLNPRKTAAVTVQKVDTFAPHTEFQAMQGRNRVINEQPSTEDDLYVVATVRVTDKLRIPISLDSNSATMTTADGNTIQATVVPPSELPGLEETFPQIHSLVSSPTAKPINFDDTVAPGKTRVGSVVLLFPQVSAKMWHTKQSANLALNLAHDTVPLTVSLD